MDSCLLFETFLMVKNTTCIVGLRYKYRKPTVLVTLPNDTSRVNRCYRIVYFKTLQPGCTVFIWRAEMKVLSLPVKK